MTTSKIPIDTVQCLQKTTLPWASAEGLFSKW
uniref:Uncharacterized protein n=1 Tax=Siphoviridae sp. ctP6113 TaxID=2826318 RepID=A0A8S5MTM5_9CAUD|nr:MAG TPA: hypothetical protein [Siphoviridae sp. ctP6113]